MEKKMLIRMVSWIGCIFCLSMALVFNIYPLQDPLSHLIIDQVIPFSWAILLPIFGEVLVRSVKNVEKKQSKNNTHENNSD